MSRNSAWKGDLMPERVLAERFALLKVALAFVNIPILMFDRRIRVIELWSTINPGLIVAVAFAAYMILGWQALRRRWVRLEFYRDVAPFLDIVASVLLILVTGGYLGPFNVWLFVCVIATAFSGSPRLPLVVAVWAFLAQIIIALFPQPLPFDLGVFIVRAGYNFGIGVFIALVGSQIFLQASALAAISRFGASVAKAEGEADVLQIFRIVLFEELDAREVTISLNEPLETTAGTELFPLAASEYSVGVCRIGTLRPLRERDRDLIRVLSDRLCAAIQRIRLGRQLVEAAAREERRRFADEMHDTHLQVLAAVDMHAEVARRRTRDPVAIEELTTIKFAVRDAAAKTRRFIEASHETAESGPRVIRQILRERWPVGAQLDIDPAASLSEGQWRAVRMLLQEGLNNAKNHGQAQHVKFSIVRDPSGAVAVLEADGRSPREGVSFGYGLSRLDTVVKSNGGQMKLEPGEGSGSRLEALFVGTT